MAVLAIAAQDYILAHKKQTEKKYVPQHDLEVFATQAF
jgi:hypothetical protein